MKFFSFMWPRLGWGLLQSPTVPSTCWRFTLGYKQTAAVLPLSTGNSHFVPWLSITFLVTEAFAGIMTRLDCCSRRHSPIGHGFSASLCSGYVGLALTEWHHYSFLTSSACATFVDAAQHKRYLKAPVHLAHLGWSALYIPKRWKYITTILLSI